MQKEQHNKAKYTSNENRPGYKETKLGWIPEEWKVRQLDQIVAKKIVYGIVQAGRHVANGMPYIRSTDLNHKLDTAELPRTSIEIATRYSRSEVFPGDIVFSLRGNIGVSQVIPKSITIANLTQGTARISLNDESSNIFIKYAIQNKNTHQRILAVSKGSTFKEISLKDLRKVLVVYPEFKEQQKIATILSTWDKAIDLIQQLITTKEEQKKGLMQRLLTPKSEWRSYTYKQVLDKVDRPLEWDDEALYELISVRRRSGGLFHRESLYGYQIKTKNLRIAKTGDFLISKMQVVHGASALTTDEFNGMKISGSYIALVSKDEKILDIKFLNWLSKTQFFYHQTFISSYGVHIEKMTFDYKSFLKQEVKLPTVEEQKRVCIILDTIEVELGLLRQKLKAIEEQKRGLMQRLLTGKIRV